MLAFCPSSTGCLRDSGSLRVVLHPQQLVNLCRLAVQHFFNVLKSTYSSTLGCWSKVVQVGRRWYKLVEGGTSWSKVVQVGRRWYKLVEGGASWSKVVQVGRRWYKLVEGVTGWSKVVQVGRRWYKLVEDGTKSS